MLVRFLLTSTYVTLFLWNIKASLNDGVTEFYDAEDGPVHMIVSGSVIVSDEPPIRSSRSFIPRHIHKAVKRHRLAAKHYKISKSTAKGTTLDNSTQLNNATANLNSTIVHSLLRHHDDKRNITTLRKKKHNKKLRHKYHFNPEKQDTERGSLRDEIPNKNAQKKTIYPPPSNMWAINKELSDTEHTLQEKGELGEGRDKVESGGGVEKETSAHHSSDIVLHAEVEKEGGQSNGRADAIPRPGVQEDLKQVLLAKGTVPKYVVKNSHTDHLKKDHDESNVVEPGQQIDKEDDDSQKKFKQGFRGNDINDNSKEDSSESFDDVPPIERKTSNKAAEEIHKVLNSFTPKEEESVEEGGSLMHGKDSENEIKQHNRDVDNSPTSQDKTTADTNDIKEGSLLKTQNPKHSKDSSLESELNSSIDREVKHIFSEHKKRRKEEKDSPNVVYPGPSFPELKRRKQLERQTIDGHTKTDQQQVQIIPKKNFMKNEQNENSLDKPKENDEKLASREHTHHSDNSNNDKTNIDLENEKPVSAVKNEDNQITISADAQDGNSEKQLHNSDSINQNKDSGAKTVKAESESTQSNLHETKETFNFDQNDSHDMDNDVATEGSHLNVPLTHPTKETEKVITNTRKDNKLDASTSVDSENIATEHKPATALPGGVRLLRSDGKPASDQEILSHARAIQMMREQNKHPENQKSVSDETAKHISKFANAKPLINQNSKEPLSPLNINVAQTTRAKQMTGCKKGEFECNNFVVQDSIERIDPSQMDNPEFNKITNVPPEPNPVAAQHQTEAAAAPQIEQPLPLQETPDLSVSKQDIGTATIGSAAGFSKEELDAFDKQIQKANGGESNQPMVSNPVPVSNVPPPKPAPNAAAHAALNVQPKQPVVPPAVPQAPVVQSFQGNANPPPMPAIPPAIQQPLPLAPAVPLNAQPPQANAVPPAPRIAQVAAPPQPQITPAQNAYQITAAPNGGVKIAQGANGQHDPLKDITINTEGDTGHGNKLGTNQIVLHTWSVEDPLTAHTKVVSQDQAPYPGMVQKPIQAAEKPADVIRPENVAMQTANNNPIENKAAFIKDERYNDQLPEKTNPVTQPDYFPSKQTFAAQENGLFAPKGSIVENNDDFSNRSPNNVFASPPTPAVPESISTVPANQNENIPNNNKAPNNEVADINNPPVNPDTNTLQATEDAFATGTNANDIASSNVKFDNAALSMPNSANTNAANQADSTSSNKLDFPNMPDKNINAGNDARVINLPDLQSPTGGDDANEIVTENAAINNNQQIDGVPIGTAQEEAPQSAVAGNMPNSPQNTAFAEVPSTPQANLQANANNLEMPIVTDSKETASNNEMQPNNPQMNPKIESINSKANAPAIADIKNSFEMAASAARIAGPSSAKLQPKDITIGFSQWPAGVNPGAQYSSEMIDLWKVKGIAPERGYLRGKIQEKKHKNVLPKKYAYQYGQPSAPQTVMSVLNPRRPTGPSIAYDQAFPDNQYVFTQSKSTSKSKASKGSAESSASNSNRVKDTNQGAISSTGAKTRHNSNNKGKDKSGYGYGSGNGYGYGEKSWGWGGGGGWAGSPPPNGMPSPGDFSRTPQGLPNFPNGKAASPPAGAAPKQPAVNSAPAAPGTPPAPASAPASMPAPAPVTATAAQATYSQPQPVKPAPKVNDKLKEKFNQKNKGKQGKQGKSTSVTNQFKTTNQLQNFRLRKIKYNINQSNRPQLPISKNNANMKKPRRKR